MILILVTFVLMVLGLWVWHKQRKFRAFKKIPGPSQFPLIGNLHQIDPKKAVKQLEEWSFEYGPIYQVNFAGRHIVVLSDVNEILSILKKRPDQVRRDKIVTGTIRSFKLNGLFSMEGQEWKESRQIVATALGSARVLEMRPCIIEHALSLRQAITTTSVTQQAQMQVWYSIKTIEDARKLYPSGNEALQKVVQLDPEQIIDVLPVIQNCILNIVAETTLSYGLKDLFNEHFFKDIQHLFENINQRLFTPLRQWVGYNNKDDIRAQKTAEDIGNKVRKVMAHWHQIKKGSMEDLTQQEREVEDKLKRTLIHNILSSDVPLSEDSIIGNIAQVMIAGYETTAMTLFWSLYYLAKYPEIQKKVQQEADKVIGNNLTPSFLEKLDVSHFPYIHKFIREVLRIRPVAGLLGGTSSTPLTVMGHTFPEETEFLMLTRLATLCYTPTPRPDQFNPDRWENISKEETGEPSVLQKIQANVMLGFGGGSRICPGRHLAMMEMVLITAIVFAAFDVVFFPVPTGHEEIHEVQAFTMKPENLKLWFKPRPAQP